MDMMHDERYVYMKRNFESADVVELPFSDQRFCMLFVVCQDYNAIAELGNRASCTPNTGVPMT